MLFSQTTEYALRAIVALASHPGVPQTTQQIAMQTQVPANYLAKLLHTLGKAKLVEAQRGVGGGFRLARHPRELTVLDVVTLLEPIGRIEGCPLKLSDHRAQLCPLHHKLDRALALIEHTFASTTIDDLIVGTPLCPRRDAEPSDSPEHTDPHAPGSNP